MSSGIKYHLILLGYLCLGAVSKYFQPTALRYFHFTKKRDNTLMSILASLTFAFEHRNRVFLRYIRIYYYMAGSASEKDEANPVFRLTTRSGKMGLSCPLGISRIVPAKAKFFGAIFWSYSISFFDQAGSVKMARYWPRSFFCVLWTPTSSRSIKAQKEFSRYQPSWPHAWSITYMYTSSNHRLKIAFDMFVNSWKKQYRWWFTPC